MEHGLTRRITVGLMRQHNVTHGSAVTLDRRIHALRLNRESPRVVVGLTVNEQDRLFDLVRVIERRHPVVNLRRLPIRALLVLESERCECAIVCPTARNAGTEQIAVRKQVGGHERAVAVTTHANAMTIADAELDYLVHGG